MVAARRSQRDSEAAAALRHAQTRETAERYRLALRSPNDAVWDWNLAAGHVFWNQAVATLFGHEQDASSANWWLDHIHPRDRPRIDSTIHAAIDGQGRARCRTGPACRCCSPAGTRAMWNWRPACWSAPGYWPCRSPWPSWQARQG